MSLQIDLKEIALDPKFTFDSGQVFRWKQVNGDPQDWLGIIRGNLVRIKERKLSVLGTAKSGGNLGEIAPIYFSSDDDLTQIYSTFPKENVFLQSSVMEFSGLRLLTQDPWECLISFVCSINCNIPSIKMKIENISRKYGEQIECGLDDKHYTFPAPSSLAKASKSDLLSCKLGFRWKYVKFIAKQVEQGSLDLQRISTMPYPLAVNELISDISGRTLGVGPKVADCALLYSFHKKEAFPLDVWILKYVQLMYAEDQINSLSRKRYFEIGEIMRERLGANAGYAQLYIYEKIRRSRFTRNKELA